MKSSGLNSSIDASFHKRDEAHCKKIKEWHVCSAKLWSARASTQSDHESSQSASYDDVLIPYLPIMLDCGVAGDDVSPC